MEDKLTLVQALMFLDELNAESQPVTNSRDVIVHAIEEAPIIIMERVNPRTHGPVKKRGKGKYRKY